MAQSPREDTVIFDLTKPLEDEANFNWLVPGAKIGDVFPTRRDHGARQVMWEPLFQLNLENGALEPWLATSIKPNPDQTVWTLILRDDATWSDVDPNAKPKPGEPVSAEPIRFKFTAEDVRFTTDMLQNPDVTVYEAVRFRKDVARVEAVDAQTVRFHLHEPNPRFALEHFGGTAFGSLLIMPEHIWKGKDAVEFKFDKPIGTGPYTFKNFSKDEVVYALDPGWWGAKSGMKLPDQTDVKLPVPLELHWRRVAGGENESLELLKKGELDAAREYTLKAFKQVTAAEPKIIGWTTASEPAWNSACARQLEINTQPKAITGAGLPEEDNPWSAVPLRKALALLVDRQKIVDNAYGKTTTPSRTMFVEYGAMATFINGLPQNYHLPSTPAADDAAKADQLLMGAGYAKNADGKYANGSDLLKAKIVVNDGVPMDVRAVEELERQLEAAGIEVTVDALDNNTYWGWAIPKGNYQMAYGWLSCGSLAEPYTSMARYANDPALPAADRRFDNTGRWDTPAAKSYRAIIKEMAALPLTDAAGAPNQTLIDRMKAAYQHLNDEMPFIPVVQTPRIMPFNTTFWTGWPTRTEPGNPAHDWGSLHLLLQKLRKASP